MPAAESNSSSRRGGPLRSAGCAARGGGKDTPKPAEGARTGTRRVPPSSPLRSLPSRPQAAPRPAPSRRPPPARPPPPPRCVRARAAPAPPCGRAAHRAGLRGLRARRGRPGRSAGLTGGCRGRSAGLTGGCRGRSAELTGCRPGHGEELEGARRALERGSSASRERAPLGTARRQTHQGAASTPRKVRCYIAPHLGKPWAAPCSRGGALWVRLRGCLAQRASSPKPRFAPGSSPDAPSRGAAKALPWFRHSAQPPAGWSLPCAAPPRPVPLGQPGLNVNGTEPRPGLVIEEQTEWGCSAPSSSLYFSFP